MFKARSKFLKLQWWKRFQGEDDCCKLCGEGVKDLLHFIKECGNLNEIRNNFNTYASKIFEETLQFIEGVEKKMLRET